MLLLIALAVAFIYLALLYAAPGPDKSGAAAWSAPLQPKVLRNLVLSVVIFFSLDGVIFHTRLYQSLLDTN